MKPVRFKRAQWGNIYLKNLTLTLQHLLVPWRNLPANCSTSSPFGEIFLQLAAHRRPLAKASCNLQHVFALCRKAPATCSTFSPFEES